MYKFQQQTAQLGDFIRELSDRSECHAETILTLRSVFTPRICRVVCRSWPRAVSLQRDSSAVASRLCRGPGAKSTHSAIANGHRLIC